MNCYAKLTESERAAARELLQRWSFIARPEQLAPSVNWDIWLLLAGRGFGKTRSLTEWVKIKVEENQKYFIGLVSATAADVRDVLVEGESGLLNLNWRTDRPKYEPSKRKISFAYSPAIIKTYSAEESDRLRGPQHHYLAVDEIATYNDPELFWSTARLGLRLGQHPQAVVATTPRPIPLLKRWIKEAKVYTTTGSTYDNLDNLAPSFRESVLEMYAGTRLEAQEILGKLLELESILFTRDMIGHIKVPYRRPNYSIIIVGVDPPGGATECGIVVCGKCIEDKNIHVLEDASFKPNSPNEWAQVVSDVYHKYRANVVVAEKNYGGDMVRQCLKNIDSDLKIKEVVASKSKRLRAEPVSLKYEKGYIQHLQKFKELEEEMINFDETSRQSPNRLDALVWAVFGFGDNMGGIKVY